MVKYRRNSLRPVLSPSNNDYVTSSFNMKVEVEAEQDKYKVSTELMLKNKELEELIKDGKAKFLVRFYCPYTNMRDRIITIKNSLEMSFGFTKLMGDIYISAFIVAVCDIGGFRSDDFHADYGYQTFDYKKGQLLAESDVAVFFASSSKTITSEKYSPITIVKGASLEDEEYQILLDNDSIVIEMSPGMVNRFKRVNQRPQNKANIYCDLVVPVLAEAIGAIKEKGTQEYENYKWFMIIKYKLCEYITITDDAFDIGQYKPWTLAQQLMGNPLGQALDVLCVLNGEEDEN